MHNHSIRVPCNAVPFYTNIMHIFCSCFELFSFVYFFSPGFIYIFRGQLAWFGSFVSLRLFSISYFDKRIQFPKYKPNSLKFWAKLWCVCMFESKRTTATGVKGRKSKFNKRNLEYCSHEIGCFISSWIDDKMLIKSLVLVFVPLWTKRLGNKFLTSPFLLLDFLFVSGYIYHKCYGRHSWSLTTCVPSSWSQSYIFWL